jgi:spore germination cell wall hydrolase CwlJ-like protein
MRSRASTKRWWTTGAIVLAGAFAVSAASGLRAIADYHALPSTLPIRPGAVAIPARADAISLPEQAAPAAGVTGTIELPALPSYAAAFAPVLANAAAPPFAVGRASGADRARALECLTAAIHYESASESDAGQRAVAQVVLNRVRHPAFPGTVCGVVYQGSARRGCQFSFACDGAMARVPGRASWARAARHAAAALAGGVYAPVGLATHYHTFAVRPVWNRSLVMTDVVGAHFFHRWKGWWGTPGAFRQAYVGGEPVPGPQAPPPAPALPAAPAFVAATGIPVDLPVQRSDVSAAITDSGTPLAAAPVQDALPPASQVLDRWKDSGEPLR